MQQTVGLFLVIFATLAGAESIIVNRSINTGRIDIGPNAHTGSIIIDGKRIETSSSNGNQTADPKVVEAEVNRRLGEAARRVHEQLNRIGVRH